MLEKPKAPAAYISGGASGSDVVCLAAFDDRFLTENLSKVQQNFVARRTRLAPDLASVVASLAFGGRAA